MVAATSVTDVCPTLWGFDIEELHARYWAARGVCVVRQGEVVPLADGAELFLLTDPRTLAIFQLRSLIEVLCWLNPDVLIVRLRNLVDRGYRERALTDSMGQFQRFERTYGGSDARLARVALTRRRDIAETWQHSNDVQTAWRTLRTQVDRPRREIMSLKARSYDRTEESDLALFVHDLIQAWPRPAATIPGLAMVAPGVWALAGFEPPGKVDFFGPAWIGAGRVLDEGATILGPAALWDSPQVQHPDLPEVRWEELEPMAPAVPPVRARKASSFDQSVKRAFDIVFSLIAILLTLPIYPIVILAIWLEDGRPFFFAHRRETLGGREFPCIKFRSMRKDADKIKAALAKQNQADGPQFFMKDDPRLTRVGRLIRKLNVDELPQFINVLLGDMSVVGPRPSPRKENQFCPPWREARLSVRPGITGLWQVRRTRQPGLDFQEWIKYDIQYVENAGFFLDLRIVFETVIQIFFGARH